MPEPLRNPLGTYSEPLRNPLGTLSTTISLHGEWRTESGGDAGLCRGGAESGGRGDPVLAGRFYSRDTRTRRSNDAAAGNWRDYFRDLGVRPFINLTGVTQLRLRFQTDDDNDAVADVIKFHSGNSTAANRPMLVVEYSVP